MFMNDVWYFLAVCKLQGMWLPQHTSSILKIPMMILGLSQGWEYFTHTLQVSCPPTQTSQTSWGTLSFFCFHTLGFCWQNEAHQELLKY